MYNILYHMWPVIVAWNGIQITTWGISLAIAFIIGSFVLWRRLREDYDGESLLTLWLWIVVAGWIGSGVWACGWFRFCLPPIVAIDGGLIASVLVLAWWSRRRKWNFWELIDVFVPISLGVAVLASLGWGPSVWPTAVVATLGVILAAVVRSVYRDFHWYKSGKTGFVGMVALSWWGVVQLVIANFDVWGLYSLGWILITCLTALYVRSERMLRQDLNKIWPRKKA